MEPGKPKLIILFLFIFCIHATIVPDDCEDGFILRRKLCFGLSNSGGLDLDCVKNKNCETLLIIIVLEETVSYSLKSTYRKLLSETCKETGLLARVKYEVMKQLAVAVFMTCTCCCPDTYIITSEWNKMECNRGNISLSQFTQVEQSVHVQMVQRSLLETDYATHPYDWTFVIFLPMFVDENAIRQCKEQSPNCFGFYDNINVQSCIDNGECRFVVFFEKVSNHYLATIVGRVSNSYWLAFGLSKDQNMGDDFVVECATDSKEAAFSVNEGKTNLPIMNTKGAKMTKWDYIDHILTCQYQLDKSIEYVVNKRVQKLTLTDNEYHVLVAFGQFEMQLLNKHKVKHSNKYASTGRLSIKTMQSSSLRPPTAATRNATTPSGIVTPGKSTSDGKSEDIPDDNNDSEEPMASQDSNAHGKTVQNLKSGEQVKSNLTWIYVVAGFVVFFLVLGLVGAVIIRHKFKKGGKGEERSATSESQQTVSESSGGEKSVSRTSVGPKILRKFPMNKQKHATSVSKSMSPKEEALPQGIISVKSTTSNPVTLYRNPKFS